MLSSVLIRVTDQIFVWLDVGFSTRYHGSKNNPCDVRCFETCGTYVIQYLNTVLPWIEEQEDNVLPKSASSVEV